MNDMDTSIGGAPYVGSAVGGAEAVASNPMRVEKRFGQQLAKEAEHILLQPGVETQKLFDLANARLSQGAIARDRRIDRYAKIDRLISTWQKLDPKDSRREQLEDLTGAQSAISFNLPVLASHLNDMVSYFAEALAPVSNPFFTANGDDRYKPLLEKFNRDAAAKDYFGNLCLTLRALMKYNLGGLALRWDSGEEYGRKIRSPGNCWESADPYNTLWDPSVKNPKDVAKKGEWAATVRITNRLELIRRTIAGEWVGLDHITSAQSQGQQRCRFYKEPSITASMTEDGQDVRTSAARKSSESIDWDAYGYGLATDMSTESDGFEIVDLKIWLIPAQYGLLTDAEREQLEQAGIEPETFIELWELTLCDGVLVAAEPHLDRTMTIQGEVVEIPLYLAYMTQDQLKEAQRSFMELMRGFQRFSSAMYNIYIAGMRKNVWGLKGIDPTMFDASKLKDGDVVGILESKIPGRDVRTGLLTVDSSAGVENSLNSVDSALQLKDRFFPSQAMPSQVAGIDRAIKSQVQTVVHGAVRPMKTLLRILDSSLMLPTRMGGYRNLKRFDPAGIEDITDEEMAKAMGSGIESIEAERVAEVLWQLLYAVIQNQESMQVFNVPAILNYLSRVGNLSVNLGDFARQPAQEGGTPPQAPGGPEGGAEGSGGVPQG